MIHRNSARTTEPNDSFASNSALAQSARGRWSYFALFGVQTIGAVVLIWTGLARALARPAPRWATNGNLSANHLRRIETNVYLLFDGAFIT